MTNESVKVTQGDYALAEEVVSAANVVSHDGYYEVDIDAAAKTIAAWNTRHQFQQREAVDPDELLDMIDCAISDSFDMDWTSGMGADAVVGAFEHNGWAVVSAAALTTPAPAVSTEDEQVETIATFLLGSVNAPEQEIYRVSRAILSRLRGDSE